MKKLILSTILFAVGTGGAAVAHGQVPSLLNFQGKLLEKATNNPRNGPFDLTFRVCNDPTADCSSCPGAVCLWTETQNGVPVANGVFAVKLGDVNPIPASVFAASPTYLEVQVGAEVGSPRQQLVTSPYAFTAQSAQSLVSGAGNYVQVTSALQDGATFYVSSATVSGPLAVGGVITAGSGANAITTPAGLVDAAKLSGTVPSAQLSGTYSNALTLSNSGNAISGNGANLVNVTAAHLLPGDTNYVQNRATLQAGTTFYVAKGTVAGPFTATGTVTLGGTAGVNDVTVTSNLSVSGNLAVSGAGPHTFTGDIRVNGNDIQDSAGTSRLALGDPLIVNAGTTGLGVPSGQRGVMLSTSVFLNGTANMDNFIAFPFSASTAINPGDAVVISGANTVGTVAANANVNAIGFAVTGAVGTGDTVWVAMSGIITNAMAGAAITSGAALCTSSYAAGYVYTCAGNVGNYAPMGKALTGTNGAGQSLSVVIFQGK